MRPHIVWTIFRKEITEALRDRITLAVMILLPLLLYPLLITGMSKMQKSDAASADKRVSRIAVWGEAPPRIVEWLERTNIFEVEPALGLTDEAQIELEQLGIPDQEANKSTSTATDVGASTNASNNELEGRARHSVRAGPDIATNGARPVTRPASDDALIKSARDLITEREADAVLVVLPGFTEALQQHGLGKLFIYYDSVRPASQQARNRLANQLHQLQETLITERERERGLIQGF